MADLARDLPSLSTDYPIALLPVRIETRFVAAPPSLQVRVYPDEIFADGHRPQLTAAERADAEHYWTVGWAPADELAAWTALVGRYGAERAAFLVHATEPTNLTSRPTGAPSFPPANLTDAALPEVRARLLPSAWLVLGYRGGVEVVRAVGGAIAPDLPLSFAARTAPGDASLVTRDELTIERALLWTIDYAEAVAVGMAVTVPLTAADLAVGFDRVLVLGVRTGTSAASGATELAALLDAHHYTRSVALVAQGTPTNGSSLGPSGYPPPDDPARSFAIERGGAARGAGPDATALADALGLPRQAPRTFDRVDGAQRTETTAAAAMNRALWPCTLGYFLEQMMSPLVDDAALAAARAHFCTDVRGRGPLPAFRIGRVPYGVLPTTSVERWAAATDPIDTGLAGLLRTWRQVFLGRVAGVPRVGAAVGATSDPDADLLAVLERDAASRELRVREVHGPAYRRGLSDLLGWDTSLDEAAHAAVVGAVMTSLGLGGMPAPRLGGVVLAEASRRIARPWVTDGLVSETDGLSPNYLDALLAGALAPLRAWGRAGSGEFDHPVLFHLLRQALLVEYARVATGVAIDRGAADAIDRHERELHGIGPGTETRVTAWQRLEAPLAGVTGDKPLGEWVADPASTDARLAPIRELRQAIAILAKLPTAELERLMFETLDTCSHRLDAWLTSLATRRLRAMRAAHAEGVYVGAFGWVEDLRPHATSGATAGGYVHAPSMAHAATAAILRNAHLTRTGAARARAAVDLSSTRVRGALELLDAVRQGLPLGAVLGYRLERALHEAGRDRFIAPWRRRFPLGRDPGAPVELADELVAARNVVDGLALRTAVAAAASPWSVLGEVTTSEDRVAVAEALAVLERDVDALADVLLAESVYQTVQGKTERAGATLQSLAGGGAIPDPEVVATPTGGTAVTHRVAVVLGVPVLGAGWTATPRHRAEPRLSAWFGTRLGDPTQIRATASYDVAGSAQTAVVTLADLGLAPIDVVAMTRTTDGDGGGELTARLRARIAGVAPTATDVRIDLGRPADGVGMLEALELARLLDEVVAAARPLTARDLVATSADPVADGVAAAELTMRAQQARAGLSQAAATVATALAALSAEPTSGELAALTSALWALAAYGVRAAITAETTATALRELAARAVADADARHARADAATDAAARIAAIFADGVRVLPTFAPANSAELAAALAYNAGVGREAEVQDWLIDAGPVRPALDALRLADLAVEATTAPRAPLALAQVPHVAGARWIGARFDPTRPEARPRAGAVAIVMTQHFDLTGAARWAGLLIDEWTERIPETTRTTAFAVHHDAPGAEAPQCLLLAVPPVRGGAWDLASLIAIVGETLDLAKLRAVDAEQLGLLGMFAPTSYLAANLAEHAISSAVWAETRADVTIAPPE